MLNMLFCTLGNTLAVLIAREIQYVTLSLSDRKECSFGVGLLCGVERTGTWLDCLVAIRLHSEETFKHSSGLSENRYVQGDREDQPKAVHLLTWISYLIPGLFTIDTAA